MTSTLRSIMKTPQFLVAQIFLEIVLTLAILGVGFWVYTQSQTQHQICQLITYFGDQTQHGIDTNSQLIKHDMQVGTASAKADAVIRRRAVSQATTVVIHLNKIHC